MKISLSVFLVLIMLSVTSYSKTVRPIDKAISARLKTISSTNNAQFYLTQIQNEISSQQYQEFTKLLGQNKNFQARKNSNQSFSILFSGKRWVRFTIDTEKAKFLVNKKPFHWNLKKSLENNLDQLYSLINQEYPKPKAQNLWSLIIPKTYAWPLFGNSEDEPSLIVVGTVASTEPFMGLESFLNRVEVHCQNPPHPFARSQAEYFSTQQRIRLQSDFSEAKEAVSYGNWAHMYGLCG